MAYSYKPTAAERRAITAAYVLMYRSLGIRALLDECHKRDKAEDRHAARNGLTPSPTFERQGHYVSHFWRGLRERNVLARDLYASKRSYQELVTAGCATAGLHIAGPDTCETIKAGAKAHEAAHSRAIAAL